jgi:hypothetical protein
MASGEQRGPVSDPGEIHHLRNCVSNLISLQALPVICAEREPSPHLSVLPEALIPMLHLAFVYARAIDTVGDSQWLILDNRTLTLVRDTDVTRAIPEFVLDHEGVKRFNWASQNRRVGS